MVGLPSGSESCGDEGALEPTCTGELTFLASGVFHDSSSCQKPADWPVVSAVVDAWDMVSTDDEVMVMILYMGANSW